MQSFRNFIEQIQENPEDDLQEFFVGSRARPEPPTGGSRNSSSNKRTAHKSIEKLWKKFLKDVTKLDYVVPREEGHKTITLHNTKFSPNDFGGRFKLELPSTIVKRLNI